MRYEWKFNPEKVTYEAFCGDGWLLVYATDEGWTYCSPSGESHLTFKKAKEAREHAERMEGNLSN